MAYKRSLFRILMPVLTLLVGVIVMVGLVSSRGAPRKAEKRESGALVRVVEAKRVSHTVVLSVTGTAQPARSVTIIPQVDGMLKYVSDSLVEGGIFPEGKVLVKIEDVDYRLNVERAGAALATAEYELAKIESEARVARRVWNEAGAKGEGEAQSPNPLVIYTPQLKRARAGLVSAKAALTQEQVKRGRTVLRAPFNSIVRSESVELGQYVRAGSEVATLIGTDAIEVVVPLKVDDLEWIDIPVAGSKAESSRATVSMEAGGRTHIWKGRVVRSLAEVDPDGRMMRVVVRVEDPYGLRSSLKRKSGPPLAAGSFVSVEIEGGRIDGVFAISRGALRDGSTLWIAEQGKSLKIKSVTPVRIESDVVIIREGITEGALVIVTDLSGAADGMKLRTHVEDGGVDKTEAIGDTEGVSE